MADPVTLRPGAPADVDRVFAWANDPVTRANSFSSAEITYEGHVRWYRSQLESEDRNLYIALDGEEPVAVVRLDRDGDDPTSCVVGINVAPTARGRGIGVRALEAGTEQARALGFRRIVALIRPENTASVRAFTRAGYQPAGTTEAPGLTALRYVLEL